MVHLLVVLTILVNSLNVSTITIYSQVQRVLHWQEEQGRIMLGIALETNLQIHLSTLTNTFSNWGKYIWQLGKIHSTIRINTFSDWYKYILQEEEPIQWRVMLGIALVTNLQRNSPEFWNLFWRIPLNKLYQPTDLALPHKMLTAFKHWYADGHHLIQFWKLKNYPKYFDRLDLGMQCITSSIAMLSGNIVVWKYFENLMKIFWLFWCGRNIWECHWPVPNFKPCYARNLDGDQLCDHVVHTNIWWWLHYTIVWSYRARTFDDDHNICTIVMINPPRYQWQWCDMVQHLGLVTVHHHQHHHRVISGWSNGKYNFA